MNTQQMEALLCSWGRVSAARARRCLPQRMRRSLMDATQAGEAVCRLYGEALGLDNAAAGALSSMSLEIREMGQDPLQPAQILAFSNLLGSTMSWRTANGYLDFGEAVGRAMLRARERAEAGQPRLEACRLELHGEMPVGVLEAVDALNTGYAFYFTLQGKPVRRGGMIRTCALPAASMFGIGCVIEGSHALAGRDTDTPNASVAGRLLRSPAP